MNLIDIYIATIEMAVIVYMIESIRTFIREKILKDRKQITEKEFKSHMKKINFVSNNFTNLMIEINKKKVLSKVFMFSFCFIPILNIIFFISELKIIFT